MKRATSPPELLIEVSASAETPLRLQVERGLRQAIQSGRLPAGALIPSSRVLAADLGISRGVVTEAYEQLLAEGYLAAHRGSATRVAASGAERRPASSRPSPAPLTYRHDFRPGVPDLRLFPQRAWMMSMRRAVGAAQTDAFDYADPRGVEPARRELSAYLNRTRATATEPDRMVLSTGFAQGILLVCRALRERGVRRLAVEDPGQADQCADIDSTGLEKVRIPVDDDGLRTDLLRETDAGAVLATPAHQYPTGSVLAPERRTALLEWAAKRDAYIIEDDYDAEYRYDREPVGALQGLAPERVVYMGTASKTLSPALRLGWLALPADLVDAVARAKLNADRGSPAFEQLALADFLGRGEFDRHLRKTRALYRRRRDQLTDALERQLPGLRLRGVAAGLHLLIELPPGADESRILLEAERRSIRVYGASRYLGTPDARRPGLVLGYGGLDETKIAEAVRHLAALLQETLPSED